MLRTSTRSLIVALSVLAASAVPARAGDYAVVVSSENRATGLSLAELRSVFAGERQSWEGGARIRLVLPVSGSAARRVLQEQVVELSANEYAQLWTTLLYRNAIAERPPAMSTRGALEAVTKDPTAIAIVEAEQLGPGVRALPIGGLLPGAEGYPLRSQERPPAPDAFARNTLQFLPYLQERRARFEGGAAVLVIHGKASASRSYAEQLAAALRTHIGADAAREVPVARVDVAAEAGVADQLRQGGWNCAMLASDMATDEVERVVRALADRSVLSIGSASAAARLGASFAIVQEGDRPRVYVNRAATERSGFHFSPLALTYATVVEGPPPGAPPLAPAHD